MIKKFVSRWEENKNKIQDELSKKHPNSYKDLVKLVIQNITSDDYEDIDPERIHEIDDGDYQGTLLYVIANTGYQPSDYYYVKVSYGSCSGCDTLQSIKDNYTNYEESEKVDKKQLDQYMQLALHIVQGIKFMGEDV